MKYETIKVWLDGDTTIVSVINIVKKKESNKWLKRTVIYFHLNFSKNTFTKKIL